MDRRAQPPSVALSQADIVGIGGADCCAAPGVSGLGKLESLHLWRVKMNCEQPFRRETLPNSIEAMSPFRHLKHSRTPPPGDTGQEKMYLRSLSERHVTVAVQLRDGETVSGWIEYFDDGMIRLTRDAHRGESVYEQPRESHPNLFIYKHQIRTITELSQRRMAAPATKLNGEA